MRSTAPNFAQKFDELCATVVGMGFKAIDIWAGHLDPARASDGMVSEAVDILKRHGLQVVGYTAGMMKPNVTIKEAERNYKVAKAIGTPLIGLRLHPSNERLAFDLGREYGIKYAIENHPEHTPRRCSPGSATTASGSASRRTPCSGPSSTTTRSGRPTS